MKRHAAKCYLDGHSRMLKPANCWALVLAPFTAEWIGMPKKNRKAQDQWLHWSQSCSCRWLEEAKDRLQKCQIERNSSVVHPLDPAWSHAWSHSNLSHDSLMILHISYLHPSLNSCAKISKVQTFTIPWRAAINFATLRQFQRQR